MNDDSIIKEINKNKQEKEISEEILKKYQIDFAKELINNSITISKEEIKVYKKKEPFKKRLKKTWETLKFTLNL